MSRTVEVQIRVADLQPVKVLLDAARDLAEAVDSHLAMPTVQNYPKHAETLERALNQFKATVTAQTDTPHEVTSPAPVRCDCWED